MSRAQGAIDAARAAGAERYAAEAFAAATTALQQSYEAVEQRDYRLALSRALDASERAQEAARQAADGKAKARSESEAAVTETAAALQQLQAAVDSAAAARVPARELLAPRRVAKDATTALQEAREDLKAQRYLEAGIAVKGIKVRITAQISAVEKAASAHPSKPARRKK